MAKSGKLISHYVNRNKLTQLYDNINRYKEITWQDYTHIYS